LANLVTLATVAMEYNASKFSHKIVVVIAAAMVSRYFESCINDCLGSTELGIVVLTHKRYACISTFIGSYIRIALIGEIK
jgi:hypothetical protein